MKYIFKSMIIFYFLLINSESIFSQTDDHSVSFIYAKKLFDDQMYDLAAEQFHSFAEQYPDQPRASEALLMAGMSYYKIKEYQKAKKEFVFLILKFPDAKDLDQAHYKIAECFEATEDFLSAANAYHQVQIFYPKSAIAEQAMLMSAKLFFKGKEYEKTAEIINDFLELFPLSKFNHEARLLLADAFTASDRNDRALIELEKLLGTTESSKINAEALLKKANLLYKINHLQDAEDDYLKLIEKYASKELNKNIEINPIINESYFSLSEIYRKKGMFEKSNEYLSKISDYQNQSRFLFLMAENFYSMKKFEPAIDHYNKIINMSDSSYYFISYYKVGRSYQVLNDYVNAINAYEQVIKIYAMTKIKLDSEIYEQSFQCLSDCYINLNQPKLAIAYLKNYRANTASQNYDWIDYQIAYLYETKANDFERAIRAYFDFIDQHGKSKLIDDAHFGLARCYEKLNNYSQALIEYNTFLQNFPSSRYYAEVKKRINYIQNYYSDNKDALKKFGGIIEQITETDANVTTFYNLSLVYFNELKDYEASANLFHKIQRLNSPDKNQDELLYYWGRSYQLMGEKLLIDKNIKSDYLDSADQRYIQLIENFPGSEWADDAAYHRIEIKKIFNNTSLKESLFSFIYKYTESPILDKAYYNMGLLLIERGIKTPIDSLDVYNNFENILTKFPQSEFKTEAAYYQAFLYYQRHNFVAAEQRLNSYIKNSNMSLNGCDAYFLLAKIAALNQDTSKAINYLHQITTQYFYSDCADSAQLLIGKLLLEQKKYSEAILHYKSLYEEYKNLNEIDLTTNDNYRNKVFQEVLFNLATLFKLVEDKIHSVEFFQEYLNKFPTGIYADKVLFSLAEILSFYKLEDQNLAINYLKQLYTNFPDNNLIPDTFIRLGDLYFEMDNYATANDYYSKALKYPLQEDKIYQVQAQTIIGLYRSGQLSLADDKFKIFEKLVKDQGDRISEILLEKGKYYFEIKNFKEAEKIFKDVKSDFKKLPDGAKAEFLLAKLYFTLNRDKEALEGISQILEKYPNDKIIPEVYITLGNFYYLQAKQIENAMLAFRKAIEQPDISSKNLLVGMNNLIKCYSDLQLWDRAIAISRDYLEKFPNEGDAVEKKIQIGYFYYRLKEYDYSIQLFKKLKPEADLENEPRIQYWIGECYFEKGQFHEAIQEYLKIVYLSRPTKLVNQYRVTAQYQSGIAYIKLGNYENAKQLFQKIVTEQGAESVFGKPAKLKLEEINRLKSDPK